MIYASDKVLEALVFDIILPIQDWSMEYVGIIPKSEGEHPYW